MRKRFWSVIAAGALISSVFTVGSAQAAPEIPASVQVDDPKGDANGINDQDNAYGTPLAGQGDHNQATVGNATDLLKIWFSNTDADVSLHFQTNGDPNKLVYDTYFRFSSNAGEGAVAADKTRGCLQWVASLNGSVGAYTGPTEGVLTDKCNVGTPVVGTLVTEEGPDKTFITSLTFPRSYSPLLADGGSITTPFGVSRIVYYGPQPQSGAFVTLDNTKRGTDYAISSGGAPVVAPPVKETPPVKNGCKKNSDKGKKKGCDKGKGPKTTPPAGGSCAAYTPGDKGAAAETTVVTDAATKDAPIVIDVPMARAMGDRPVDSTAHVIRNVQLDTAAADAGLFARLESPTTDDPDLYVYWPSGKEAAVAGGFNQALFAGPLPSQINDRINLNGTGKGGHSGFGFEQIDGLRTPDCAGWTLDLVNWLGQGGTYKLKLWVGEVQNEPAPEK